MPAGKLLSTVITISLKTKLHIREIIDTNRELVSMKA